MRRFPKPWFRQQTGQWYVQLGGRQIPLGSDRDAAFVEYHRLMQSQGRLEVSPTITFAALADLFLDHAKTANKPATIAWYRYYLESFAGHYVGAACDLKPSHVNAWLAEASYPSRRAGVMVVKRVLCWSVREGHLKADPLANLQRLKAKRRESFITEEQHVAILQAATDRAFFRFVRAMHDTGARPGEIRKVTATNFFADVGLWVLQPSEAVKPTDRPRIIYLTPKMVRLCKTLAKKFPDGPLFRNRLGKPWTHGAIRQRMEELRKKGVIPTGAVAYGYRHGFATRALRNGVTLAELKELMGHTDLRMLAMHYGHLDGDAKQLREAAKKAAG